MPSVASPKPGRNILLQTEDVIVNTQSNRLTIRSGPSTSYSILEQAPKGTVLVRIEKAQELSSDERYWDRVVYNTGSEIIIGYASREYLADTVTTEKVNEERTISVMCNLRNGPSTTKASVKQILSSGTKITIIDKMDIKVDGHIWYRVKLTDGTQGYVSSAYIQELEQPVEPEVPENPETPEQPEGAKELYKIEGNYFKIAPGTDLNKISGVVLEGTTVGTGASITFNETVYTLVVIGDCDGDGKVNSMDMYKIIQHILGNSILEKSYFIATDTNSDSKIDSMDMYNTIQLILNN